MKAQPLPIENYKSLLFDLDGTLVDTMAIHNQAWMDTLTSFQCPITFDALTQLAGVPNLKIVEIFNQQFGWNLDGKKVVAEKDFRFQQNLSKIKPISSVLEIALEYQGKMPMAIVTGGTKNLVAQTLSAVQIENLFPIRVCADDVAQGKPHPESFLLAAKILNIKPEQCLVFEDGEAGIRAAQSAGMGVVKVNTDFSYHFLA